MNSMLSAIKAFVLKNRPAYKDYLGNGKYDVKKLPEECVPDSINDNIRMAQSTADEALSTANTAKSTADTAKSTADAAQSAANAAQSTANAAQSAANAAQSTADAAQSTANAAQSTAESAKIEPNSYNYTSCLISRYKKILGWFSTYVVLEYDTTRGCFHKSVWESDPITSDQMPEGIFGSNGYFAIDGRDQEHMLLMITKYNQSNTWLVKGLAFSLDSGKIYVVETAKIPYENATGLFFEFTPVEFSPIIPSSTPGSTKKFKITVDDSGTISATEVT